MAYGEDAFEAYLRKYASEEQPTQQAIPKANQNEGLVDDLGTGLKVGGWGALSSLPEIADIPVAIATGYDPFTQATKAIGEATGFQPGRFSQEARQEYRPEMRQHSQQAADIMNDPNLGYFEGLGEAISYGVANPEYLPVMIAESLPYVAQGGALGRGMKALGAVRGAAAGYVGEGLSMAGTASQEATESGASAREAALTGLGVGVMGGAVGALGGRIARSIGLEDIDILAAGGRGADDVMPTPMKSRTARTLAGGGLEMGEEMAQSTGEAVAQNIVEGKENWMEGAGAQAGFGGLAGFGMGAAANLASSGPQTEPGPRVESPPVVGADPKVDIVNGAPDLPAGAPPVTAAPPATTPADTEAAYTADDWAAAMAEQAAAEPTFMTGSAESDNQYIRSKSADEVLSDFMSLDATTAFGILETWAATGTVSARAVEMLKQDLRDAYMSGQGLPEQQQAAVAGKHEQATGKKSPLKLEWSNRIADAFTEDGALDNILRDVPVTPEGRAQAPKTIAAKVADVIRALIDADTVSRKAPFVEGSDGGDLNKTATLTAPIAALQKAIAGKADTDMVSLSPLVGKNNNNTIAQVVKRITGGDKFGAVPVAQVKQAIQMIQSQLVGVDGDMRRVSAGQLYAAPGKGPTLNQKAEAQGKSQRDAQAAVAAAFDEFASLFKSDKDAQAAMDKIVGLIKTKKNLLSKADIAELSKLDLSEDMFDEETGEVIESTTEDGAGKSEAKRRAAARNKIDTLLSRASADWRSGRLNEQSIRGDARRQSREEGGNQLKMDYAEFITNLKEHGKPMERTMASILDRLVKSQNLNIRVEYTKPDDPTAAAEITKDLKGASEKDLLVTLKEPSPQLFLHEVTHAAVKSWIAAHPNHGSIMRLTRAYDQVSKKNTAAALKEAGLTPSQVGDIMAVFDNINASVSKNGKANEAYIKANEIIAYALTNQDFAKVLRTVGQGKSAAKDTTNLALETEMMRADMTALQRIFGPLYDAIKAFFNGVFGRASDKYQKIGRAHV